ncbi:MAG: sigma-70 family RNA polymerase sigma factor, partial [Eubacterium sp.]|nr:sigma-70 family RNA polymerase sigma factor [Eubacterium sp.]
YIFSLGEEIMKMLNNLTETEILSLSKEGDNEALTFIITRYRAAVEVLASKYSDSPIEREDLIQEGMIGLLAAINSFDCSKGAAFSTYCYTCINNSLQTALRKVSRRKDVPQNSVVPLEEEFVNSKNSVLSAEDSFLAQESVSMLTQQLQNELSEFENNVLRLHMIGCSYREIANKLGKTPKAIDNALQRIRKKLKVVSF